jgi:hypothetical protein
MATADLPLAIGTAPGIFVAATAAVVAADAAKRRIQITYEIEATRQ